MPRVVAITGAGTDAAVATARRFAEQGDAVALLSRTPASVDAVTSRLEEHRDRVLGVVVDTSDPDAVERAADRVETELGPVDVWVNTTEDTAAMPFDDLHPAELRRVTDLLYVGHVHTTMTALERMRERGQGTIVHVTTPLAWRGRAGHAAASGAQAALRGFHEAVADELLEEQSPVRTVLVEQADGVSADTVARGVLTAVRTHDRRGQLLRAGVIGTGAAVAAGTAALVRRRRR